MLALLVERSIDELSKSAVRLKSLLGKLRDEFHSAGGRRVFIASGRLDEGRE